MSGPTFNDIQQVANIELEKKKTVLLGVTKETPRYIQIPADSGVYEFVVDCYLLEDANQIIALGSGGLTVMKDVLVIGEMTGDLLADINVPVEIRRNLTGQLTIMNRAKVTLPALRLDEYDEVDLGIHHVLELTYDEVSSVWRDSFGFEQSLRSANLQGNEASVGRSVTTSLALSTLGQLGYDNNNNPVDLGVNQLQRSIATVTTSSTVEANETVSTSEEQTVS